MFGALTLSTATAWAQTTPSAPWALPAPPPSASSPPSSEAATAPEGAPRPRSSWSRGSRILAESLGAVLGAAVGAGGGFITELALVENSPSFQLPFLAAFFAMPAGVTVAGSLGGADGRYGYALLGATLGAAVAIPLSVALDEFDRDAEPLVAGVLVVLPIVGAITGYELSNPNGEPRARSERDAARDRPRLVGGGLRPTQGGFNVGAAWQF